jgi:hypothetical protein
MKRSLVVAVVAVALALGAPAGARGPHGGGRGPGGFGGHGGARHGFHPGFGHHSHGHVFVGGSVFFDPFYYDPFFYPYYVPYPYPAYVYPPPPDYAWSAPPEEGESPPPEEDASRATYGLLQLRGIPDGAAVDLDGRFWLTAQRLDDRWLAVPRGEHTVTVHVRGADVVERRVDVKEGKNHVVRFGPFRHATG